MSEAIRYFFNSLTGNEIERLSGGRIKRMDPFAAAGLIGSWMVETGSDDLSNLDVVEVGNNQAGRGLSQYSHSRRGPYDRARQAAIGRGIDPNSKEYQLQYFVEEYLGKHDPAPGKSLIGWTKSLDNLPEFKSVAEAATHFTKNYFRPSTPHLDRRIQKGEGVYNMRNSFVDPNSQAPAAPTGGGLSDIFQNTILKKLGLKGGKQSFNIDKLESTLGEIAQDASAKDVGFGIFASQKGNRNQAKKSWANLSKREQRAYTKVGRRALASTPNAFAPAGTDYSQLKIKGNRYGKKAFDHSGRSGKYDYSSYSGSQDLNKTLDILNSPAGKAAARGGDLYGQAAMNLNAQGINTIAWQL